MALHRGIDGSEPIRPVESLSGTHEVRKATRTWVLAEGTLACPGCDAPVAPDGPLSPGDPISCPVCARAGRVRDFLSLEAPTRPARVVVRVTTPAPRSRGGRRRGPARAG